MPIVYVSEPPAAADLVIVGGGIVGAATAFHASRAGLRPLVLERRPALSTLTTAAAAGGYRLQVESREELELIGESVELFLHFEDATGQREHDAGLRQHGYLWVTTSDEGVERQRRLVEAQRSWGLTDVQLIADADLRKAFPFLDPGTRQARFRQADGLIDPKGIALGLAAGATMATFAVGCDVVGIDLDGDGVRALRTTKGTVATRSVVIAAGPFSGLVARLAGVHLPIETVRRQKVVLPEVPEVPRGAPMTIDDDTGAHWRPAFGGAFLLFTDPSTPPSPPVDSVPTDPAFAFQLLDPQSPQAVARISPFWRAVWGRGAPWLMQAGHYTMTPDRQPLIGPSSVPGLLVNTGYSGRGVMGGPAGSRILVDVLTGKLEAGANPFRLDREPVVRQHLDPL